MLLKTNTLSAEDRFSSGLRRVSIPVTSWASDSSRTFAMDFSSVQNSSSSENEVLCPRIDIERFFSIFLPTPFVRGVAYFFRNASRETTSADASSSSPSVLASSLEASVILSSFLGEGRDTALSASNLASESSP